MSFRVLSALLACAAVSCSVFGFLTAAGCAAATPARYVIERDLGAFVYRRYQKMLDVELSIDGNAGVGHSASYVQRRGDREIAVTTAVVSVYDHSHSLAAEAHERLAALSTYQLSVRKLSGAYVWQLYDGKSERWAVWVSGHYLVKIGAPAGEDVPEHVVSAYVDAYPSDLDEHGLARAGTPSAGTSKASAAIDAPEMPLPASLREGAPR